MKVIGSHRFLSPSFQEIAIFRFPDILRHTYYLIAAAHIGVPVHYSADVVCTYPHWPEVSQLATKQLACMSRACIGAWLLLVQ